MKKRIHRVTVCLTEEEHLRLNEMCKATGLTMSKLIRQRELKCSSSMTTSKPLKVTASFD